MKIYSEFLALKYRVGNENEMESYQIEVYFCHIHYIKNHWNWKTRKKTLDVLLKGLMKIFSVKHTTCFLSLLPAG